VPPSVSIPKVPFLLLLKKKPSKTWPGGGGGGEEKGAWPCFLFFPLPRMIFAPPEIDDQWLERQLYIAPDNHTGAPQDAWQTSPSLPILHTRRLGVTQPRRRLSRGNKTSQHTKGTHIHGRRIGAKHPFVSQSPRGLSPLFRWLTPEGIEAGCLPQRRRALPLPHTTANHRETAGRPYQGVAKGEHI
jgi:hypothetical protein